MPLFGYGTESRRRPRIPGWEHAVRNWFLWIGLSCVSRQALLFESNARVEERIKHIGQELSEER